MPVGDSNLELLEPLGDASTVGKFIERKGEGIHHICFEVDDVEASLDEFRQQGARLIDEKRRQIDTYRRALAHVNTRPRLREALEQLAEENQQQLHQLESFHTALAGN